MMRLHALLVTLALVVCSVSAQQTPAVPRDLISGLESFEDGLLEQALDFFRRASVLTDDPYYGHARFWSARTLLGLGLIDDAAEHFDRFLADFTPHPYREEATYQQARVSYIVGDHELAVQRFSAFLDAYPGSSFESNALYWTGEALLALGRLDAAQRMFVEVTTRFPTSFRYEAAEFRQTIIELRRRENELLTLIRWSHQEYLSALEAFELRERDYQQQLRLYRTRLANLADEDFQAEISDLGARVRTLQETVEEQRVQINQLLAELRRARVEEIDRPAPTAAAAPVETTPQAVDVELRDALRSLRDQALELQDLLIDERERSR